MLVRTNPVLHVLVFGRSDRSECALTIAAEFELCTIIFIYLIIGGVVNHLTRIYGNTALNATYLEQFVVLRIEDLARNLILQSALAVRKNGDEVKNQCLTLVDLQVVELDVRVVAVGLNTIAYLGRIILVLSEYIQRSLTSICLALW